MAIIIAGMATPESLRANPRTPATSAPSRQAAGPARAAAAMEEPVRRSIRNGRRPGRPGPAGRHARREDVPGWRPACAARHPGVAVEQLGAKRPRWVRWSAGRARSSAARPEMATTVAAPMARSRGTLTRQPPSQDGDEGEGGHAGQHATDVGAEARPAVDDDGDREDGDGGHEEGARLPVERGAGGHSRRRTRAARWPGPPRRRQHGEGEVAEALEPPGHDRRVAEGGVELQVAAEHDVDHLHHPVQRDEGQHGQERVHAPGRRREGGEDGRGGEHGDDVARQAEPVVAEQAGEERDGGARGSPGGEADDALHGRAGPTGAPTASARR